MNWLKKLIRYFAIVFGAIGGAIGAFACPAALFGKMTGPIDKLNLPEWTYAPISILSFIIGGVLGFLLLYSPYWILANLFKNAPEDGNSKERSE